LPTFFPPQRSQAGRAAATATVRQALELIAERGISSVLVMLEDSLPGIFTERDYARKIALKGRTSEGTLLSEVMTSHLPAPHGAGGPGHHG
jgi:CBS domain-containing protein